MTGTDDAVAALRSLIDVVAASENGTAFAATFGDPAPSERRLGGLHVPLADGVFRGLDIRPWTAGTVGVVDVDLPADTAVDWEELRTALPWGPVRLEPHLDPGPLVYSVGIAPERSSTGAAAVLLLVEVRGRLVSGVTLRRDPPLIKG